MREFLCETQDLAIGYGQTPLASGIALGANPGQILVLVGPNGAGKSTLLKTLAGQLAPLGGTVLLDGQDLTAYTGTARAQKLALMLPHTRRTELTTCFEFAAACTLPQVMPEKLPCDQLCRLTMLESCANATTNSVTAEQM